MKVRGPRVEVRGSRGQREKLDIRAWRLAASDLALRTLHFVLCPLSLGFWLLAAPSLLAAATNTPGPDDIPPLRPPHAEMPPTFWEHDGLWVIVLGILFLALACAAGWFLLRPKPPVIVPPGVRAREALEPLRQAPEDGLLLSRVSHILRQYVAAAFDLPPGELTTTEFCRAVGSHASIGPELSAALSDFLRQCDQRKFTPPASAPPLGAVAQVLKLIELAEARRAQLRQAAEAATAARKDGA